ncbi:hypothetical protein MANES_13G103533v8 [Manihot esculenta]|uniref:Uncharacterized protein n=1 Tax=Manihot esculenta TaxID=3983 RepID=A0ACB7GMA5_MANES|nr:hypothetical protein MANES_13G103533v8 [Manihot esculenta]
MSEKLVVNFGLIAWIPTNSNEIIWQDIFPSLLSFLFPMNQILSPSNFFSFLLCSQLEHDQAARESCLIENITHLLSL